MSITVYITAEIVVLIQLLFKRRRDANGHELLGFHSSRLTPIPATTAADAAAHTSHHGDE